MMYKQNKEEMTTGEEMRMKELQGEIEDLQKELDSWKGVATILYEDLKYGFTHEALERDLLEYEELRGLLS